MHSKHLVKTIFDIGGKISPLVETVVISVIKAVMFLLKDTWSITFSKWFPTSED